MCGRFTQRLSTSEFARIFDAEDRYDAEGGAFNVAPTDPVAAVVERDSARAIVAMRWGLVPQWAKSAAVGSRMINARAETLERSAAFVDAFRRRRCLIPADGFYEWRRDTGGPPQPFYISRADGTPLVFAGLRAAWRAPGSELVVRSCTIVTTVPNAIVEQLHNRMPVVLAPEDWRVWLDEAASPDDLRPMLRPAPDDALVAVPVSTLVNSVRNQGPELVVPIGAPLAVAAGASS